MAAIAGVQLLILDDWGLEPLDAAARHDLYEILEERYGRRSTILTSQIPVDKWHAVIGDPTPAFAGAGLYGAPACQAVFPPLSVAPIAARQVDRLQLFEIELGDRLQLVGQSRSFEVFRQVVQPGAIFVLESDQHRYRCRPTLGPWRQASRRRGWWGAALLAPLGAVPRLSLGCS